MRKFSYRHQIYELGSRRAFHQALLFILCGLLILFFGVGDVAFWYALVCFASAFFAVLGVFYEPVVWDCATPEEEDVLYDRAIAHQEYHFIAVASLSFVVFVFLILFL